MFPELKIKLKSLAAEIVMIHVDENKHRRACDRSRAQLRALQGAHLSHKAIRLMGGDPKEGTPPRMPKPEHQDSIRAAEKANSDARYSLGGHRAELRQEYRCALLAYAFLRGRPYVKCETNAKEPPSWSRIQRLAQKFGRERFNQAAFDVWYESAADAFLG